MLHTKPQGHWLFGFGEKDFWRVFTIYGRGSHLGQPRPRQETFVPPPHWGSIWNWLDWPSGFGEDLWKLWTDNWWMDDGPWLYYKLANEPKGSGELKTQGLLVNGADRNMGPLSEHDLRKKKCSEWISCAFAANQYYGFLDSQSENSTP